MRVITVGTMKGGVGKTTLAILLARWAKAAGKRVLVIDQDPQSSLTNYFVDSPEQIDGKNLYRGYMERSIKDAIAETRSGIDIVASTYDIVDLRSVNYKRLATILKPLREEKAYDLVIIDTAGAYDNHMIAAAYASDVVIMPTQYDQQSLFSNDTVLRKLAEEMDGYDRNRFLVVENEIDTQEERSELGHQYQELIEDQFGDIRCTAAIPKAKAIKNAKETEALITTSKARRKAHEALTAVFKEATGFTENVERF